MGRLGFLMCGMRDIENTDELVILGRKQLKERPGSRN